MAIIKNNFLVGTVGKLIFKVVNGKQVVSTKVARGTIRQSKESMQKAQIFGLASRFGSEILRSFKQYLNCFQDPAMFNRLIKKLYGAFVYAWNPETLQFNFEAHDFHILSDFNYNINSPLRDRLGLKTQLTFADGLLYVGFSAWGNMPVIKFLKDSNDCAITVGVSLYRLQDGFKTDQVISQRQIVKKYDNKLEIDEFQFKVPGDCLCVTSIFLNFYTKHSTYVNTLNSKKFSPSAICGASFTPGSFDPEMNIDGLICVI